MVSRKTYSNLINQEEVLNEEETNKIIEFENYIKDIKRYKEYTATPFTEEVINGYDSQIAFLESLKERNGNQSDALERSSKIIPIESKLEERRKKEELKEENILNLTRTKQRRAGYTNASVIIFVVLNLGFLIAALLLSIK